MKIKMIAGLALAGVALASAALAQQTAVPGGAPYYRDAMGAQQRSGGVVVLNKAGAIVDPQAAPTAYSVASGSPYTLTSSWTKVATTTSATRTLLISDVTGSAYDIRWTVVTANASAPSAGEPGQAVLAGETFPFGLPIGDVYLKSATGAQASVYVGN